MAMDNMSDQRTWSTDGRRAERTNLILALVVFVLLIGAFVALSLVGR